MKISNSSASAAGERAQDGADHSWVVENIINKASFTTEVERQLIQHSLQSREKQSPSKKSNSKATFYGSSANEADSSSKHEDPAEIAPENGQDQEWYELKEDIGNQGPTKNDMLSVRKEVMEANSIKSKLSRQSRANDEPAQEDEAQTEEEHEDVKLILKLTNSAQRRTGEGQVAGSKGSI